MYYIRKYESSNNKWGKDFKKYIENYPIPKYLKPTHNYYLNTYGTSCLKPFFIANSTISFTFVYPRFFISSSVCFLSKYKYKAVDLIRWIREEYGDYFTIAAAGKNNNNNNINIKINISDVLKKLDNGLNSAWTIDLDSFKNYMNDIPN